MPQYLFVVLSGTLDVQVDPQRRLVDGFHRRPRFLEILYLYLLPSLVPYVRHWRATSVPISTYIAHVSRPAFGDLPFPPVLRFV